MMGEAQAKIVIDADAARVIAEAVRAQKAVKKIGTEAKDVGKAMETWGGGVLKSLVGVGALVGLIRGAAAALKEANAAAAAANKTSGGGALARSQAAGRLGITNQAADAMVGAGRRSRDERTGFLTALAEGGTLDSQSASRAADLYGSGLFEQGEVIDAARGGRLSDLAAKAAQREAALSPDARAELDLRSFENQNAESALTARATTGARERQLMAIKDEYRARNRGKGAALDALSSVTAGASDAEESLLINGREKPTFHSIAQRINREAIHQIVANTAKRPAVAPAVGKN